MGMKTDSILTGALARASSQLSSGGRMVLMHPESLPIPQSQEWVLEEEHTIYVHKRLTRAISVLRRQ
jgi:tRNA G10  N-methylase Trm11